MCHTRVPQVGIQFGLRHFRQRNKIINYAVSPMIVQRDLLFGEHSVTIPLWEYAL